MKKLITVFLTIVMVCCLCGCQSKGDGKTVNGEGVRIYVSLSQADTFRNTLLEQATQTAEKAGAEIVIYDAENSVENQVAQIKQAVKENYDVIMCAAVDADTAQEMEALAGDIPIVFYNTCPDASVLEADKYMYVGSDEEVAGQYQAEYVLENFKGESEINVVIIKGVKNHSATEGRVSGLKKTFAQSGKKVNYVFEDYADWDGEKAEAYFEIFLRTKQDVDVIVCQNDTMALGVIEACKKHDMEDVMVLGIDATADGCAAIEDGDMAFTVYQSAKGQGEMAVYAAIALGSGESTEDFEGVSKDGCYIWVPFEKVDAKNVASYK